LISFLINSDANMAEDPAKNYIRVVSM